MFGYFGFTSRAAAQDFAAAAMPAPTATAAAFDEQRGYPARKGVCNRPRVRRSVARATIVASDGGQK